MAKRISPEERVLRYFREAPLDAAAALLKLAQAEVRVRQPTVVRRAKAVRTRVVTASSTAEPTSVIVTGSTP